MYFNESRRGDDEVDLDKLAGIPSHAAKSKVLCYRWNNGRVESNYS